MMLEHVPPRNRHYRAMGTVSNTTDIFLPIKPHKESHLLPKKRLRSEVERLVTFLNWDSKKYGALQSLLAQAGFFYTGQEDTVECFACGARLSKWDADKNPVKEHEVISPACLYKKLNIPLNCFPSSQKTFTFDFTELPGCLPLQDSPTKAALIEEEAMQCDLRTQGSNNNPVQIDGLQSLPVIKNSLPSNASYNRFNSYDGHDVTDMFSIANPKERCAHPRIDILRNELQRLRTFQQWHSNAPVTAAELARAGFFYVGPNDRVQCAFCRGILRNWAPGDSAAVEHQRHFPTCGFISRENVGNIPLPRPGVSGYPNTMSLTQDNSETPKIDVTSNDADMYQETGIIEAKPKHPELATVPARLATYQTWPSNVAQRPQQLAECGFYSLGIDDSVKCFFCDVGLRSWEENDDPWVEHARWFKTCGYLRQTKGNAFIRQINDRFPSSPMSAPGVDPVEPMVTSSPDTDVISPLDAVNETPEDSEIRAQLQRPDFQETLNMGFTQEQIIRVLRRRLRKFGKPFIGASELVEALLNSDESSSNSSDSAEEESKDLSPSEKVVSNTVVVQESKEKMNEAPSQSTSQPAVTSPPTSKKEKKKRRKNDEPPTDSKVLQDEIRVLKEERVCKVCLDEAISIVFLPCGHMVCCGTCAPALRNCPICRENIKGNVKAYIA